MPSGCTTAAAPRSQASPEAWGTPMPGAAGDSQATLPYGTHPTASSPPRAGPSQPHGAVREAAVQSGASAGPSLAGGGQGARQPPKPPGGTGRMVRSQRDRLRHYDLHPALVEPHHERASCSSLEGRGDQEPRCFAETRYRGLQILDWCCSKSTLIRFLPCGQIGPSLRSARTRI